MHRDTPRHIRYATGYIGLNLLAEAAHELEAIAVDDRHAPPVLAVALELHMAAKDWESAGRIGQTLARNTPENENAWISWAYALRELQRIEEARDVLLEAEPLHGKTSSVLHYNLACYYCLLGDLPTARQCLNQACKLQPGCRKEAREDPDLEAIWPEL
jgi:Flp pilus assembly protein TadD